MIHHRLAASLAVLLSIAALPAAAADRRVELVNASGTTIIEFHASNTNRSSYEEDILGKDVLEPGQRISIDIDDGTGACKFDFLTVLQGGRKVERRGVDVCEISTYTVR